MALTALALAPEDLEMACADWLQFAANSENSCVFLIVQGKALKPSAKDFETVIVHAIAGILNVERENARVRAEAFVKKASRHNVTAAELQVEGQYLDEMGSRYGGLLCQPRAKALQQSTGTVRSRTNQVIQK